MFKELEIKARKQLSFYVSYNFENNRKAITDMNGNFLSYGIGFLPYWETRKLTQSIGEMHTILTAIEHAGSIAQMAKLDAIVLNLFTDVKILTPLEGWVNDDAPENIYITPIIDKAVRSKVALHVTNVGSDDNKAKKFTEGNRRDFRNLPPIVGIPLLESYGTSSKDECLTDYDKYLLEEAKKYLANDDHFKPGIYESHWLKPEKIYGAKTYLHKS